MKKATHHLHHDDIQNSKIKHYLWYHSDSNIDENEGGRPFRWIILMDSLRCHQFSSVAQSWLFATPWTAAHQPSLFITNTQSLPKQMSIGSVMQSNHLILCCPLLLLPPIFTSIRGLFKWVSSLHQVAKVLEFQLQHQSFQWTPRTDLL